MKKITRMAILFLMAFGFRGTMAQVSFPNGSKFTAIDDVTIVVDVSGTNLAGESAVYIWIFSNPSVADGNADFPKKDGAVNGTWGNSDESAKLTSIGGNIWSFTFKATELFGLTPAKLKDFGFLVKTKTGSKQTPDYKPYAFDPLVFTPIVFRVFPQSVGVNDVVSINFNQALAIEKGTVSINVQRMAVESATVALVNSSNEVVATLNNLPVRSIGSKQFASSFYSGQASNIPQGTIIKYFRYKFNGNILAPDGTSQAVSTEETQYEFLNIK